MELSNFDFTLPEKLIAKYPLAKRSDSRLLYYNAGLTTIEHHNFKNIVDILQTGDILVRNTSKVLAARLFLHKINQAPTTKAIEILLTSPTNQNSECYIWNALAKPAKKLKDNEYYLLENNTKVKVIRKANEIQVDFGSTENFHKAIDDSGYMPIPPYFKRLAEDIDKERYQTIYAQESETGDMSVAAPTAGLHFTDEIFTALKNKGIKVINLSLHVGLGTFAPIKSEHIEEHKMHSEKYHIEEADWQNIVNAKRNGSRIIAIGSTSTRTLESIHRSNKLSGETDIYIYPGNFEYKVVDGMITNFHLPKSSLILMVSAFIGIEECKKIYAEAINKEYRFYSYGDCSLLLK